MNESGAGPEEGRGADRATPSPDCLCMGCGPQLTALIRQLLGTDGIAEHLRSAQLEALKLVRALIDQRIEGLSGQAAETKGTRLTVE